MAWEKRRGIQRYLYISRRQNGRMVKEYVGRGPLADIIARLRDLQQAEEQEAAEVRRYEHDLNSRVEADLRKLISRSNTLIEAVRVTEHTRTASNRREGNRMTIVLEEQEPPGKQALVQLVKRASQGDPHARETLSRVLDRCPAIWRQVADLAGHVEATLVDLIAGKDELLAASLRKKARQMRDSLQLGDLTAVQQLAAERVVATWLHLQYLEMAFAVASGDRAEQDYWGRRRDKAHTQHLEAVEVSARLESGIADRTEAAEEDM